MALIICPECGKKFSDRATSCPECGLPTKYALEEQKSALEETIEIIEPQPQVQPKPQPQVQPQTQPQVQPQPQPQAQPQPQVQPQPQPQAQPRHKQPKPQAQPRLGQQFPVQPSAIRGKKAGSGKLWIILGSSFAGVLVLIAVTIGALFAFGVFSGYDNPEYYDYVTYPDGEGNEAISIIGLKNDKLTVLRIPDEIDNKPVRVISRFSIHGSAPDKVKKIVIPDSVMSIFVNAFSDCTNLETVNIPDSVELIGEGVFANCHSLKKVIISDRNKHFVLEDGVLYTKDKSELISAIPCEIKGTFRVPEGVTKIDSDSFCGCGEMTEILIPASVENIGAAFTGCTSLKKITVDEDNSHYCSNKGVLYTQDRDELLRVPSCYSESAFSVPDTVDEIDYGAFEGCANIEKITLPESVSSIKEAAFENCVKLKTVVFPKNTPNFDGNAFRGCTSLDVLYSRDGATLICVPPHKCSDKYVVSENVNCIGAYAFAECQSLESVIIPSSVLYIDDYAFTGCSKLAKVDIPDLVYLDRGVFSGCTSLGPVYSKNGRCLLYVPRGNSTFSVKKGTKSIGPFAFRDCGDLKEVEIPDSVEIVDPSAFSDCYSLEKVTIPDSVTEIGYYAFENCISLKEITIPKSVIQIGDDAFYGCDGLTIHCQSGSYAAKYAKNNDIEYVIE